MSYITNYCGPFLKNVITGVGVGVHGSNLKRAPQHVLRFKIELQLVKVGGRYIETSCVFFCIRNTINAEMWA